MQDCKDREFWVQQVITKLGGTSAISSYLGISMSSVSHWKNKIPVESAKLLWLWSQDQGMDDLSEADFMPHVYRKHSELNKTPTV